MQANGYWCLVIGYLSLRSYTYRMLAKDYSIRTRSAVPSLMTCSKVRYNGLEFPDYPLLFRDMPSEERPREKLMASGPEALSMQELLMLVFGRGTRKEAVDAMAGRVIRSYGEKSVLFERDPERLARESGISLIKACQVVAIGELGRRVYEHHDHGFTVIRNAKDVHELLTDMRTLPKEYLRALFLNSQNRIIRNEVISIGSVDSNIVEPKEVFRVGLEASAVAVILAHNHPSGNLAASAEDVRITERLVQAGKILGIHVLDHVIITRDGFVSVPVSYN